jgi:hypothetical protein
MGRFAESIGKTVEEVQLYRQAFAAFTGGTTNIEQTIRRMKIDLSAAPLKYTPWMTAVERLIYPQTVRGQEPEQILQEISVAAARRNMNSAQVVSWLEGTLPLTPEDVLLLSKPGGLQEALETQRRDVGTPTTPQAKAMERLHADITNVETTGKLLELQALTLMEPFLHELLTMTLGLLHWMRGAAQMLGLPSEFSFVNTANAAEAGGGIGGFGRGVGPFGFGIGRGYSGDVRGGGGQGGYSASGREQLGVEAEDLPWVKRMQDAGPSALIEDRKKYVEAMNDPVTREAVMARMESEVGNQDRETQQGWLETTLNRASSRYSSLSPGAALRAAVSGADGYFGSSQPRVPSEYVKSGFSSMLTGAGGGSNIAKYGTGNWSGVEGHGFGQRRGGYQTYGGTMGLPQERGGESSPGHIGGTLEMEGRQYKFGSGGAGYASIPPGDYPITPGTIGPWGQAHGALGINYNQIWDERLRRYREGIELHSGSSDELITEGCMAIAGDQWPEFKVRVKDMISKYGSAYLHVGPDGARVSPGKNTLDRLRNNTSIPNTSTGAAAAAQSFDADRPKIENNENSTHINQVTVHTHATDATGIAKDVKDAIGKQLEAPSRPWPLERLEATP